MNGNDMNSNPALFRTWIYDYMGTPVIELLANWSTGADSLSHWNGTHYEELVRAPMFTSDSWHHISLSFDCLSDTFEIVVDGNFVGNFSFMIPVNDINTLRFETDVPTANNFYAYIDLVHFVAEGNYMREV